MGDNVADVFMAGDVPVQLHRSGVAAKVYLPAGEHRLQNGLGPFGRKAVMLLCRLYARTGNVVQKHILPGGFVEVEENLQ